jgi:hypothetical protein
MNYKKNYRPSCKQLRKYIAGVCCLSLAFSLAACSDGSDDTTDNTSAYVYDDTSSSDMFSASDLDSSYDISKATSIELSDSNNTFTISKAGTYILSGSVSDGQVIVDAGKNDEIQLVLDNVNITSKSSAAIYVKKADTVYITTAENSVNTLCTSGEFEDDDSESSNVDAVIFSKDNLTLNGSGTLTISTEYGHGIVSKSDLKVTNGSYHINASSTALNGKDSVRICGGSFDLVSGKDAIHSENDDSDENGFIYISNGTFDITSDGDGISSSAVLTIDGGSFDIVSGGGNENGRVHSDDKFGGGMDFGKMMQKFFNQQQDNMTGDGDSTNEMPSIPDGFNADEMPSIPDGFSADEMPSIPDGFSADEMPSMPDGFNMGEMPAMPDGNDGNNSGEIPAMPDGDNAGEMPSMPDGDNDGEMPAMPDGDNSGEMPAMPGDMNGSEDSSETTDSTSTKGLKSGTAIVINGGIFNIDSADDSLHSNGTLDIYAGTFNIASGDDGIHADNDLYIYDGVIDISTSYEGIEGGTITIDGGNITLTASDDGLNANASDTTPLITINGGYITINAQGDGVDSNGNLVVNGGETYVFGPTANDNGAIDYETSGTITGGIVVAVGSNGMAQNFGSDSTQGSMLVNISGSAEDEITLTDSDGNVIINCTSPKSFSSVVISSPEIKEGGTYTLTAGDNSSTVEMTSLIYGNGFGFGGGMGGGGDRGFGGGQGGGRGFGGGKDFDSADNANKPDNANGDDNSSSPDKGKNFDNSKNN